MVDMAKPHPMVSVPVHLPAPLSAPLLMPLTLRVMMPFRRRSQNRLRPVNRIKHVIDNQQGIVLGTQPIVNLIKAVDNPVIANREEVQTGSTVNGIYLNIEAYATTAGALANIYILIMKNPGGNLTVPFANLVGSNDNKKYVIHQEMKMLEQSVNGNPRTVFNGVVVIPRGYRRFGPNDVLLVAYHAPGVDTSVCTQCHYKEFR